MDSFPVKLWLPDHPDFKPITPYTQCVFEVIIPIGLPRLIDSSLPAPPYIGADALTNSLQILVRPTMRAIMSGLLRELMGSDYPICLLLGSDPDDNISQSNRLSEGWDSKFLTSMADLDLESGHWKDQFGQEGRGPIDAYEEYLDGHVSLIFGFSYFLVQGATIPGGDDNPRIVQFTAEPTLSDGKVVFWTREYTPRGRRSVNNSVKRWFEVSKAREDAGLPVNGVFCLL